MKYKQSSSTYIHGWLKCTWGLSLSLRGYSPEYSFFVWILYLYEYSPEYSFFVWILERLQEETLLKECPWWARSGEKALSSWTRNCSMCSIHGVSDFSIQLLSETYENIRGMLWIKAVKAISLYSDTLGPRHLFLETPLWLWQRGFLGPEMARVHLWWVGLASVPTGIILAHGYI